MKIGNHKFCISVTWPCDQRTLTLIIATLLMVPVVTTFFVLDISNGRYIDAINKLVSFSLVEIILIKTKDLVHRKTYEAVLERHSE